MNTPGNVWRSSWRGGCGRWRCVRRWRTCSSRTASPRTFAQTTGRSSRLRSCGTGWPPSNVETLFIEPGSPWENGYVESFNGKLRDELLDREIFYTLTEAKILIERWRREYNTVRPHSALGYRPPAPKAISPAPLSGLIMSPALP